MAATPLLARLRTLAFAGTLTLFFGAALAHPFASEGYRQTNLVSDVPGLARRTDPQLVNAWGLSFSPTGPLWISAAGTGVSVVYDREGKPFPRHSPLVVTIPSAEPGEGSEPTGQVFNGTADFVIPGSASPARFIFVTEQGTLAGWNPAVNPTQAILVVDNSAAGAVYTGVELANSGGQNFVYAANLAQGTIDVFDTNFSPVAGFPFVDPGLPAGYAPFNVRSVGGLLVVAYALTDDEGEEVPGPGNGLVDVFTTDGAFVRRLISQGALDAPWGLALAPHSFGQFRDALLVGNFGDGKINAYNPTTGAFLGALSNAHHKPIVIEGLWAITFGSGAHNAVAGRADTLYFTAGPDDETHGLFGEIRPIGR
jgi:uncharacterized protein (TIGR03118 family)